MSASSPAPENAKPAVKPRNPVERLLVRGFIGVMLVLVAAEGWSWWQHKQALDKLFTLTGAVDKASNAPSVTETDVIAVVGGKKPRTEDVRGKPGSNGASRLDVFSWFTISPINKREIYVFYGYKGPADTGAAEVLSVQSKRDVPDELVKTPVVLPANAQGAAVPTMTGMGAGGPPSGLPGGPSGRPGGGKAGAPPAGNQNGDKPDTTTPDSENSAGEKSHDEKSVDEKPAEPDTEKASP